MSQLFLPLILFLGFIGFRIASIMATRKREAQLRAAWRAEVEATRAAALNAARELRGPLDTIRVETERLRAQGVGRSPAELSADLATIAAASAQLHTLLERMVADPQRDSAP